MTPQPHCDHECVCPAVSGVMRSRNDVCEVYACPNDTRSRPAPSPDPRVAFFEEDNAYKDSIIEQQRIHINTLNVKMSEMMQGAAAQAREKVLDEVKQYADTCIWVGDDCCPGKMNDQEESDCDGCSYVDYPNNADICEKIISLRRHRRRG